MSEGGASRTPSPAKAVPVDDAVPERKFYNVSDVDSTIQLTAVHHEVDSDEEIKAPGDVGKLDTAGADDEKHTKLSRKSSGQVNVKQMEAEFFSIDGEDMRSLTYEKRFEIAATFLKDTLHYRPPHLRSDPRAIYAHEILHGSLFSFLRRFCAFLLFVIPFFQYPPAKTSTFIAVVEVFIYGVHFAKLVLVYLVYGRRAFLKDKWIIARTIFTPISMGDALVTLFGRRSGVRPIRLLTMFYVIEDFRQLRANALFLISMIPTLFTVAVVMITYFITFTMVGITIFNAEILKETGIGHFGDDAIVLFQALTTVNYPDVAFPAIKRNPLNALYFILFMVIGIFYMNNLIIAQVFASYKKFLRDEFDHKMRVLQKSTKAVYYLIADDLEKGVNYQNFSLLVRFTWPSIDEQKILAIFEELSDGGNIQLEKFYQAPIFLKLELSSSQKNKLMKRIVAPLQKIGDLPIFKTTRFLKTRLWFRKMIEHWIFEIAMKLVIIGSSVALVYENESTYFKDESELQSESGWWIFFNYFFAFIFAFELFSTFMAYSVRRIAQESQKLIYVTASAVYVASSIFLPTKAKTFNLVLRALFFVRIPATLGPVRDITKMTMQTIPQVGINFVSVLNVMYFYANLGMTLFHDKLYRGNPALAGTPYDLANYYHLNFNSFGEAIFTVFHMLIVNNWHVTYSGIAAVAGKRNFFFFMSFHIIVFMVMLAVVLSFFVDIFSLQRDLLAANSEPKHDGESTKVTGAFPIRGKFFKFEDVMNDQDEVSKDEEILIPHNNESSILEWEIMTKLRRQHNQRRERRPSLGSFKTPVDGATGFRPYR